MKTRDYIMPPLVLTVICVIIAGLLAFAYNATYVDTTGIITDELMNGCIELFGEGEYTMLLEADENGEKSPVKFEGVTSIILDENDNCIFEIYGNGYEKAGLHLLIGVNPDGSLKGVSIVSLSETPGLGTRVDDAEYLGQFVGMTGDLPLSVDNITGASKSSMGLKNAIVLALETYSLQREVIFGE